MAAARDASRGPAGFLDVATRGLYSEARAPWRRARPSRYARRMDRPPAPRRSRKDDHIDLCASGDVGFRSKTTLLEDVTLVHDALPDGALEDVALDTTLFGKALRAPLVVAAMTGGAARAEAINRDLAAVAQA